MACDTLIYFGDLSIVLRAAAPLVRAGGHVVFSVERGGDKGFALTDSGRYAHSADHIRHAAAQAGLELVSLDERFLRMEYGNEVTGLVTVLRRV